MRIRILFIAVIALSGCLSAGTHGSIKAYQYPVTKQVLQNAAERVIAAGVRVRRDTVRNYMIDVTNGRNDTLWDNYYNDTTRYVTIYVYEGEAEYKYTYQYGGSNEDWDTSKVSDISIAYAWDEKAGEGGSEGHGDVTWRTPALKKRLTGAFEREFVSKIDRVLGVKHLDE